MTKDEYIKEIHNTLSELENDDDILENLENAMEYFCSTWDKCEGYKHAIRETLDDQANNHIQELDENDLRILILILTYK